MNVIGNNLNALMMKRDINQSAIASVAGVSRGAVSSWVNGRCEPNIKHLSKIADYYNVSIDDLRGESNGMHAKMYNLAAPEEAAYPSTPSKVYAPLHGIAHAGLNETEQVVKEASIPIPYEVWEKHQNGYFLEVSGTCMNKIIPEGCHVFIDPDIEPSDDSIAIVEFDGEHVMRRLHFGQKMIMLSPESYDQWDDLVIFSDVMKYVGTVVWWQSSCELQ